MNWTRMKANHNKYVWFTGVKLEDYSDVPVALSFSFRENFFAFERSLTALFSPDIDKQYQPMPEATCRNIDSKLFSSRSLDKQRLIKDFFETCLDFTDGNKTI